MKHIYHQYSLHRLTAWFIIVIRFLHMLLDSSINLYICPQSRKDRFIFIATMVQCTSLMALRANSDFGYIRFGTGLYGCETRTRRPAEGVLVSVSLHCWHFGWGAASQHRARTVLIMVSPTGMGQLAATAQCTPASLTALRVI
jgi:hypothetical protein